MVDRFSGYVNNEFTGPKGIVSNFKHAERIFVDGFYRLSPRTKYLYYIVFGGADQEMSFLVKAIDLPKASFDTVNKNVYNRNKLVYKKIQYDPINVTFHDDNQGKAHAMFNRYYAHYASDVNNSQSNYPKEVVNYSGSYGMGFGTPQYFFSKIRLFTLSRQLFTGYELLAPRIKSWTHGSMEASSNEPAENTMIIEYEGFTYSTGSVSYGNPDGFASLSYDYVPSPLKVGGGLESGGTGRNDIFGDVTGPPRLPGGFLNTAVATNSQNNLSTRFPGPRPEGVIGEFANPARIGQITNNIGGILGAAFPKVGQIADSLGKIIAKPKFLQTRSGNTFGSPSGTSNEAPPTFDPGG